MQLTISRWSAPKDLSRPTSEGLRGNASTASKVYPDDQFSRWWTRYNAAVGQESCKIEQVATEGGGEEDDDRAAADSKQALSDQHCIGRR